MYASFDLNDPSGLQDKVFLDIAFYLIRRGRENYRQMDKNTFTIKQDATGRRYISQVKDELDKNHGENDNNFDTIGEGAIYEIPESETCPVKTFEKYLSKLHPEQNTL